MKKLILSLTLTAFAFTPALRASDDKACPAAKKDCAVATKACCAAPCDTKKVTMKKIDLTIKGAQQLVSR